MSILDKLDNTSSDNLSGKVAKESTDKFNNKYLFCLTYVLAEYELVDDVSDRLMNIFSNCLNVEDFFIAKYQPFNDDFMINNTRHLNLWHVDVCFNYDYTSDADVLKFFNKMYLYTNVLSKTSARMGQISPGVYAITLKRTNVNMEVSIHHINNFNNISRLYGIFSANDEESNKRVHDLLYILRGKESDTPKRTKLEVRRIAWLNENSYELKHHYRTTNGYQYEYKVEYNHPARQILPKNKIGVYNITINCNTAILKARTLRELSLRILLFKAFIDETKADDGWNIYRDSNVISLRTPGTAYAFCLEGAYLKERRFNLTANLKDMKVMNDYVHYLYENNKIENGDDYEQFIKTLTDFVNRVTIEDVQAFIKMRSTVNPLYNNIVI